MIILLICISTLIFLTLAVTFALAKTAHLKLFNHRYEYDTRIKSYTPGDFFMKAEAVQTKCNKNIIKGYLYSCENPDPQKLIVICHGMWSSKEAYLQEAGWFASHGFLVLSFDYAGTNESSGKLDCFGDSLRSTNAMLDFIRTRPDLKEREIYVVGHSWGGYAAASITAFHPEIKGIVAISPVLSMKDLLKNTEKPYPALARAFFIFIDCLKCGKFALADGVKNIENFARNGGKVIVIQSEDDGIVPYKSSLGLLKKHFGLSENEEKPTGLNIKLITVKNRKHNPHYTDSAIAILSEFFEGLAATKEEDLGEFYSRFDFRAMGQLDDSIMQQMYDMIES